MSKKKSNSYNFIYEQTSISRNEDLDIIEESRTEGGDPKVIFKARLQEANVVNQNKRSYSPVVCESITSQLAPKASNRNLLMEIDHPMFGGGDPMSQKKRATVIEIKNCGSLLRDVKFKDGEVIGEIETLSGFKGPDLANLILKDKVDIGFSLRALGSVAPLQDGTIMVKTPIMPITYDVVSTPSHANAKLLEFLPESFADFDNDCSVICEGSEASILEAEQIHICEGNKCISKFIDDIINERVMDIISNRVNFRI